MRLEKRPFVLIVRDGWGVNPHAKYNDCNAIHLGRTPRTDRLLADYPWTLVGSSGEDVGLPAGTMGNSEVGHQNIGAGRVVYQESVRITRSIRDGSFFDNQVLRGLVDDRIRTGTSLHIMGLASDAGVHSLLPHLYAVAELCVRAGLRDSVLFHAFTDGRDTSPRSGQGFLSDIEDNFAKIGAGRIASVCGRYYAMDRDNRWDRVEKAYRMLTLGEGLRSPTGPEAAGRYYANPTGGSHQGDEFILPTLIGDDDQAAGATIADGDGVLFFNFRGDRPRELIKAFKLPDFDQFERTKPVDAAFVTMTQYQEGLPVKVVFPRPPKMANTLGVYLSDLGLRQFRCAETEKYAHVTFFFNDYREDPFPGEQRQLVPSPKVPTYDAKPEMSAHEVTDAMLQRIATGIDDVIVLNYANGDMVGHTGDLQAAIRAVEAVDECVGRVVDATRAAGGQLLITADHGNAEQMVDPETGGPHTAHTTYPTRMILVDDALRGQALAEGGCLADISPTALAMMGLDQPPEMEGRSLLDA